MNIKNILLSYIFLFLSILIGFLFELKISTQINLELTPLSFKYIFISNLKATILLLATSFLGPIGIYQLIFTGFENGSGMAKILINTQISVNELLFGLFPHGIFEFIVIGLVGSYSFSFSKYWIDYFINKTNISPKGYIRHKIDSILNTLIFSFILLLIGAYIECKYSYFYFRRIYGGN